MFNKLNKVNIYNFIDNISMFGGGFSEFIETGTDPGKFFQRQHPHQNINLHKNYKPFTIDIC